MNKRINKLYMSGAETNARLRGSCFGRQVIAQALGGKVELSVKGWETGIRVLRIINSKAKDTFLIKNYAYIIIIMIRFFFSLHKLR